MSDILTRVNQIGLNTDFPIAGQNNSSEVFRTNSRAVLAGLTQASDELTKLQATRFAFSGDAAGQSNRIGDAVVVGQGDPLLNVAFTLSNTGVAPGSYSTLTQDYSITIDAKGRVQAVATQNHSITWTVGAANTPIGPSGQSLTMGTGTGTIDFPVLTFNAMGRLIGANKQSIAFGLGQQKLSQGALLIGKDADVSGELAPPTGAGTYSLVATGSAVSWQAISSGTVSGVVGGVGIKATSDPNAPVISLDLSNITAAQDITSDDYLVWQDLSDSQPKRITYNQLRSQIVKVSLDAQPVLGGTLDVSNFGITNSQANGVVITNTLNNPTTTLLVNGNGLTVQSAAGTAIALTAPAISLQSDTLALTNKSTTLNTETLTLTATTSTSLTTKALTVGVTDDVTVGARNATLTTSNNVQITAPNALTVNAGSTTLTSTNTTVASTNVTVTAATGGKIQLTGPTIGLTGDNIQLTGQIKLNSLTWPVAQPTNGQNLQMTATGLQWVTPSNFYQNIASTVFVGMSGSDTEGNGALNNPYKTITRALQDVPNQTAITWTVMLLGGTFEENLNLQNKGNLAIEGFFGSSNTVVKGKALVFFGINDLKFSKITFDQSEAPADDTQAVLTIQSGLNSGVFKDCQFLRGPGELSNSTAIEAFGEITGDVQFTNCTIRGKVINNLTSTTGGRLIIQNAALPTGGWTGLEVSEGTNTLISGAPLMKGINHAGGVLTLENIGSIKPENYELRISNPSLPVWLNGDPVYILDQDGEPIQYYNDDGQPSFTLLLDEQGLPIPDVTTDSGYKETQYVQETQSQDPTIVNYLVGLYSTANSDANNSLELSAVNFYYEGEFSKIYKSGTCRWNFAKTRRRADQDYITGPRIAYDVQPDEGNFIGHLVASGQTLKWEADGSNVADGMIDPNSGNTFQVTLTGGATVKLKTPVQTAYAPGPITITGENYTEVLVVVKQDSTGNRSILFQDSEGQGITWITNTAVNTTPGGLTFFLFRYFSRLRKWVGQRQADSASIRVAAQRSSNYTLSTSDGGSYVRMTSNVSNTVVVPSSQSVPFALGTQIQVIQANTGQTTLAPETGSVIINTPYGFVLKGRMARAVLTKIGPDTWDLSGDLDDNQTVIQSVTADNTDYRADSGDITADGKIN